MVKRTPAELIGLLAPAGERARNRYLDIMLALGLMKITSDGKYKVTPLGDRFLREFEAINLEDLEDEKTRMAAFQALERIPRREKYGWKIRLVAPVKSHKTIAKYRLGDLIKLADRVAKDSREIERTLRKASKKKST
jgi:hypothetical protein